MPRTYKNESKKEKGAFMAISTQNRFTCKLAFYPVIGATNNYFLQPNFYRTPIKSLIIWIILKCKPKSIFYKKNNGMYFVLFIKHFLIKNTNLWYIQNSYAGVFIYYWRLYC